MAAAETSVQAGAASRLRSKVLECYRRYNNNAMGKLQGRGIVCIRKKF